MQHDVEKQVITFYTRLVRDDRHRYKSWEHCFQYFGKRSSFNNLQLKDTAALHLAFYLASWGMYRGSSFLLQKDYTIHIDAIDLLLDPIYEDLWTSVYDVPNRRDSKRIWSLSEVLREKYRKYIPDEKTRRSNPTDTLVTKILLGTVGCTPACDRFFVDGFRACHQQYPGFGVGFLEQLAEFCEEHVVQLKETQNAIMKQGGARYPIMKLVDMYFWEIGYNRSPESKKHA